MSQLLNNYNFSQIAEFEVIPEHYIIFILDLHTGVFRVVLANSVSGADIVGVKH